MLQILGAIMIIGGVIGLGYDYAEKEQRKIVFAETWEYIMYMFLSEITYKKQPLSLACKEIGEKTEGEEGRFLKAISERAEKRKAKGCFLFRE